MREEFPINTGESTSANGMEFDKNVERINEKMAQRGELSLKASGMETGTNTEEDVTKEASLEDSRKKADGFIRRHGRMLSFFAKDSSLNFTPSKDAETFAFYPKEYKVEVPLSWFASEKYTDNELQFANYHELSHFIDMRKNPEAYLENFDKMREDAMALAKKYCRTHPGEATEEAVGDFYYRELHTLYNCLDDIYVNRVVVDKNPYFADGNDGAKSITTLYEKSGFDKSDLTDLPLHRQLAFSLLRDEMIGKEHGESVVDEQVKDVVSKKMLGKNIRDLIDSELTPRLGISIDPAERYKIIRTFIQPKYLDLLEVALDERDKEQNTEQKGNRDMGDPIPDNGNNEQDPEQEDNQGANDSESQDNNSNSETPNDFDPFYDKNNRSQPTDLLDKGENEEEEIRKILENFAEDDRVKNMSKEERGEYQAKKAMEEFDDEYGISPRERAENERIMPVISGARKEMREFWKNLVGKSIEYRTRRTRFHRRGMLSIYDYIDRYPDVVEAERNGDLRNLEIYNRNELERIVVDQPEQIDVTLLVDCSGSMSGKREEIARQTAALLMYSLKDFNDELNRTRNMTHSRLKTDSQVIVFGDRFREIKSFNKNESRGQDEANIIKSISRINSDYGGTDDAAPLGAIAESLTPKELDRLKTKKLKKIVFEITDGGPFYPEETKANIKKLTDEGVIMVGFQIGDINEREDSTFKEIWGEGHKGEGIFIGKHISELPKRLMRSLSDALKDIVI